MDQTDGEYVRLCLDGRPDLFRQLVIRHERMLIAFLASRLGDRDEADEAAQEALVRAYFSLPKLKDPNSFSSWLLGIADRVARESNRRRRRAFRGRESAQLDHIAVPPDPEKPPCRPLDRALAGLPEAQRQVILLRFYGGQSCAEIGLRLGISLGTVTSRLSRAYSLLRAALREHESDPELQS